MNVTASDVVIAASVVIIVVTMVAATVGVLTYRRSLYIASPIVTVLILGPFLADFLQNWLTVSQAQQLVLHLITCFFAICFLRLIFCFLVAEQHQVVSKIDMKKVFAKRLSSEPSSKSLVADSSDSLPSLVAGVSTDDPVIVPKVSYKDLVSSRHVIHVMGDITDRKAAEFARDSVQAIKRGEPVIVEVHTDGGDVDDGWSMHEHLRVLCESVNTVVIVMGNCASAGVSFILGAPLERRWASRESCFMVHSGHVVQNQTRIDDDRLTTSQRRMLDESNERYISVIVGNTFVTEESLRGAIASKEDVRFRPEKAVRLGVIAGIV